MTEFKAWPKIQRYSKLSVTITEKIDGTNACVIVDGGEVVGAQSRNRLITPENDNMGFARWVEDNKEPLATLGDGYHYGEWAGPGIQKNPHQLEEKTFFLFNSYRWNKAFEENPQYPAAKVCSVVPTLYSGRFEPSHIEALLDDLKAGEIGVGVGKETNPEGIMIYFHTMDSYLKHHIEGRK